ncbi:C6 zinc finger domain-containing protein [Verticillium alfalfae VaMs.102]|uniref:C6 zinc finger domain-containing protein n=1 Tax=Verticillium alfalfae (strain VaMs.102 / ATCC MYA-4576 / FGSC 10136) TaxID=526221 RepID=C9SNJ2_VERA1|nr:C6 zinc finger domain-containing protein [Verticillium alfalfae VaMs.102]EEY20357.1 C6 zinc finger domain-containing protein [Verticillium alfalfae VaMs.102]
MDHESGSEPARKRLRTSHACDACRAKKIRCNGNTPCASCDGSRQECTYGSEANSIISSNSIVARQSMASPSLPTAVPRAASFSSSPRTEILHHRTPLSESHWPPAANNLDNAVLASMHTSATEAVLQWPHFDVFPGLRDGYDPIFRLEQARPPIKSRSSTWYPFVTPREVDEILESFGQTVNFWYPTMSQQQMAGVRALIVNGVPEEDSIEVCLALLTMALGLAGQVTANLASGTTSLTQKDRETRASKKAMADVYFDGVLKRLHVVHTHIGSTSTHCLFYVAMYFAFLRRPLQAWEYINAAAAKCLLLLSYTSEDDSTEDSERIRRIFWSCYILESDYLAELSALPQSGISAIESTTPLPGEYHTHADAHQQELASLYLLACISMRRLLNRVHHLLYAQTTGAALDPTRFPAVVRELNHQLDEWREVLPPAFAFTVDETPTATEAGAFLRQRYSTCRSVIYRPYFMWMLSGMAPPAAVRSPGDGIAGKEVMASCKMCLDACLLHIMNLRGYGQTVLVDTWICSLSMAGAMLVLLAACRVPALRELIGSEILSAGEHLRQLLEGWQEVMGEPASPSVEQSVRIIAEADRFIRQVYLGEDTTASTQRAWQDIYGHHEG